MKGHYTVISSKSLAKILCCVNFFSTMTAFLGSFVVMLQMRKISFLPLCVVDLGWCQ